MEKSVRIGQHQANIWAGIIGPILFVGVFTLEGWLRPGYNALSTYVSELSLGPEGWIQILNFIVFGFLFILFTRAVTLEFKEGKASRAGPILLTIIGIGFLASGPFVTDPAVLGSAAITWHGFVHSIFGAIVFSLMPVSCFIFFRRFYEDPRWRPFAPWTLAAIVIIVMAVILMKVGQIDQSASWNVFHTYAGLVQRIALITYLGWIFVFALILHKRQSLHT